MKKIILLLCLLPFSVQALDRPQLDKMLAVAATATGQPYLEARKGILDLGKDVLPLLVQAATDSKLTWQQRLVARICYERISRGADIEALRQYDWRTHPQYDKRWEGDIVGVKRNLGKIAVPKCVELGLWYYYIELAWKNTAEYAIQPRDPRINDTYVFPDCWIGWCVLSVAEQPERFYLMKVLAERLDSDASLSNPLDVDYYWYLLSKKETNAVPVLVERYDSYFGHKVRGPEGLPGAREITYRGIFKQIVSFADSRHSNLIEKFIAEKQALAPLGDKLAEVRKRPAPPSSKEPPFRLGRQSITP
jgi:hypothetical protein